MHSHAHVVVKAFRCITARHSCLHRSIIEETIAAEQILLSALPRLDSSPIRSSVGRGAVPAVSLLVAKAFTPLVLIDDDASTHKPKEVSTVSEPARYPIQYGFPARTVSQPARFPSLNGISRL